LLDNLPHMIDRLPQKIVNDKIFPQMVSGMGPLSEKRFLMSFVGYWIH
jgi:SCY1-like protein 1